MTPKYVPVLKAKKGEFDALSNLSSSVTRGMLPLFELPKLTNKMLQGKLYSSVSNPTELFVRNNASNVASVMNGASVMLDISKWSPSSTIENGEHILGFYSSQLSNYGCEVIPVVGYDRWEDKEYSLVLRSLSQRYEKFCIRLESYAFDDMVEVGPFIDMLDEMISYLDLDVSSCSVILDFADVTRMSIIDIEEKAKESIELLSPYGFGFISIAGCSISPDINGMVPETNSEGLVVRKEMAAWQTLKSFHPQENIVFGDYGISSPQVGDEIIAPDANGKIRYTILGKYFVVRGYSRQQGEKGAQMYGLCKKLIASPYYLGVSFSWGDNMIARCANEDIKGSTTQWVSIDTNHHATFVMQEVLEFERGLAHQRARLAV
ncbi:MAG: beta family protein [Parashewanella sp.]